MSSLAGELPPGSALTLPCAVQYWKGYYIIQNRTSGDDKLARELRKGDMEKGIYEVIKANISGWTGKNKVNMRLLRKNAKWYCMYFIMYKD